MISDAAQNSRFDRQEANQRELLGKMEDLEAADVYLQVLVVMETKTHFESGKTSTLAIWCICYLSAASMHHPG